MRRFVLFSVALLLFIGVSPTRGDTADETGFIGIEPLNFYFHYHNEHTKLELQSSQARIWYSFLKADRPSADTPIFVFFNGGPGFATSCGLMSMYTGRMTLDNSLEDGGGDRYIPNPFPWTEMGHLLYIDARETGFSYNIKGDVHLFSTRFREFNAQNFNPFLDGADFVRVILRFLAAHPTLRRNPVVIVGESYGGIRATVLLYLIHNYANLADETEMYQDPALAEEIRRHFDIVFPEYSGTIVPREVIARQFGRQVLIQPCVSMGYQVAISKAVFRTPGSVIYRIGEEVGVPYHPSRDPLSFVRYDAGRDYYMYPKPWGWLNGFFDNASRLLRFSENISFVTGFDIRNVPWMYAEHRRNAYRRIWTNQSDDGAAGAMSPAAWTSSGPIDAGSRFADILFMDDMILESDRQAEIRNTGDLSRVFGDLNSWDGYYMTLNSDANRAFHYNNIALLRGYEVHYYDHRFGEMFLKNLASVKTFITNAAWDLVIYSPAIPQSLASHIDLVRQISVSGGPDRDSVITVFYRPGAFADIPELQQRSIAFPFYSRSCHAVSLTEPAKLYRDVYSWIQDK